MNSTILFLRTVGMSMAALLSVLVLTSIEAAGRELPEELKAAIVSESPLYLTKSFLEIVANSKRGDMVTVPFHEKFPLHVETRTLTKQNDGFAWFGQIPALGVGDVTLSVAGNHVAGSIQLNSSFYVIHTYPDGNRVLRQIDLSAIDEGCAVVRRDGEKPVPYNETNHARVWAEWNRGLLERKGFVAGADPDNVFETLSGIHHNGATAGQLTDDGHVIDVLMVYSGRAAERAKLNFANFAGHAQAEINRANGVFSSTGVPTQLRLAHAAEVSHTVQDMLLEDDLDDLAGGAISGVHGLRDKYRADLVTLFVVNDIPSGGNKKRTGISRGLRDIAFPGQDPIPDDGRGLFEFDGFNVVDIKGTLVGAATFMHEIAHSLGAGHNIEDTGLDVGGFLPYSRGLLIPELGVKTIMATKDSSGSACSEPECTTISYFSNGNQPYVGYPLGSFGLIDNVSAMAAATWSVANYRNSHIVQ